MFLSSSLWATQEEETKTKTGKYTVSALLDDDKNQMIVLGNIFTGISVENVIFVSSTAH